MTATRYEFFLQKELGHLNFHGISLFVEDGKIYLYAVNHPPFNEHPPADTVEKFLWDVDKGVLNHEKTFSDPEFVGLNDLVVVKMDQFYISNMQTFRSKVLRELEIYLFFVPAQNVLYYDGKKATVVLPGMFGANGVDVSPDQKFLYVSEVTKKRISSYRIENPTTLVLEDTKYLGSSPDNINVDHGTGDLWIGAHPSILQLSKRLSNPTERYPSSSQVIRVTAKDGKFLETYQVFADNGHQISSSSSAAFHKGSNAFLIGTVDDKAMICKCLTCPK
ncbi:serum paraoxonase/arylesterase 2-like [Paramacrobiotus metropolitanus]|uniref:serum paraoxonase/arylesterase 2-like n=1 Tax=Paramacrobiotus metropolitanus TaxID=2943436 RepID=UPI002445F6BE|nr:serum paraoxonase/arylesterase 2-like [Paramacrobiotus metropolitanus]